MTSHQPVSRKSWQGGSTNIDKKTYFKLRASYRTFFLL